LTVRTFVHLGATVIALGGMLFFSGCGPSRRAETASSKPELSIQVASLDFSTFNRRLEKKDVAQFAKALKREQIDVLSVRGLVRYPSVASRVDLLTELAAEADLRTAFGEMTNNSGRQIGNAVFSAYPIQSSHVQPFEGVRSGSDEVALRATIDAGVRSLSIITAEIPSKASVEDQALCARIIQSLDQISPIVAAGNLPVAVPAGLEDAAAALPAGHALRSNTIWYSHGFLKPTSVRTVSTDLGVMLIARFDVYGTPQP
jgi:hypothetical protein